MLFFFHLLCTCFSETNSSRHGEIGDSLIKQKIAQPKLSLNDNAKRFATREKKPAGNKETVYSYVWKNRGLLLLGIINLLRTGTVTRFECVASNWCIGFNGL